MAIVLPILTAAIVGTIAIGWLLFSINVLFYAVEMAARCAAINASACSGSPLATQVTNTEAYAASMAYGLSLKGTSFTAAPAGCGWQVTYNLAFDGAIPFYPDLKVNVPISACYPTQP